MMMAEKTKLDSLVPRHKETGMKYQDIGELAANIYDGQQTTVF